MNVPDSRLDKLGVIHKSEKVVPAVMDFVDIAGIVKGASEGDGLVNKFLMNIRMTGIQIRFRLCSCYFVSRPFFQSFKHLGFLISL